MAQDPLIGTRIREYEIIDLIGKGGMGAVYKARHVYLEKIRAIKVIQSFLASEQHNQERFIREARILSELSHLNLVHLFEFGILDDNRLFMVMEFVEGESVLKRMQRVGKIPLQESIRIIREAAIGLQSAHNKGIIHRDISPDNLMLVRDEMGTEITKVIDFGIAKPLMDETRQYTATDMFLGKPEYCSPEQTGVLETGAMIDHRTDIYSLAVTLYYMVVGKLPFHSPTPMGYLVKHATEPPKPIASYALPEVPEALDHVVMKALSKDRNQRQSSMKEFADELAQVFDGSPKTAPTVPVQKPAPKSNTAIWVAVALFALVFTFASAWVLVKIVGKVFGKKAEITTVEVEQGQISQELSNAIQRGDLDALNAELSKKPALNVANENGETPLHLAAGIDRVEVVQALLDAGARPNVADKSGTTPLMKAAYWGFVDNIQALIKAGADVNAMDRPSQDSVLMKAVEGNRTEVVALLLKQGADVDAKNKAGDTALALAATKDNPVLLQHLIDAKADVNFRDRSGVTPLMNSSYWGHAENVQRLLKAGADVKATNSGNHETALFYAIEGRRVEVLPLLIAAKADVNAKNKSGESPLMIAATIDLEKMIKILVDARADANAADGNGSTPLMRASYWGHVDNVTSLLRAGANPNAKNSTNGNSALFDAIDGRRVDVLPILLQAGADSNAENKSGETPVIDAASKDRADMIVALIRGGADVNTSDNNGTTALMVASYWGLADNVRALLDAKADVNARSPVSGITPLINAVEGGRVEILPILITAGADVNAQTKSGDTALAVARRYGDPNKRDAMVQILERS